MLFEYGQSTAHSSMRKVDDAPVTLKSAPGDLGDCYFCVDCNAKWRRIPKKGSVDKEGPGFFWPDGFRSLVNIKKGNAV